MEWRGLHGYVEKVSTHSSTQLPPLPPAYPAAPPRPAAASGFLWFLLGAVSGFVVGVLTATMLSSVVRGDFRVPAAPPEPASTTLTDECAKVHAVEAALNSAAQKQTTLVDPQVTVSDPCSEVALTASLSGTPDAESVAALHEALLIDTGEAISQADRGSTKVSLHWMVGGTEVTTEATLNNDAAALLRTSLTAALEIAKLGPQSVQVLPSAYQPAVHVTWGAVGSTQLAMIHPDPATNPNGTAIEYHQEAAVGELAVEIMQESGTGAVDDAELRRWVDEAVRTKATSLNVNATPGGVGRAFAFPEAKESAQLEPKAVELLRGVDQCAAGTFTEVSGLGDRDEPKVLFRYDCKDGRLAVAPLPVSAKEREITDNEAAQRALDAARQ